MTLFKVIGVHLTELANAVAEPSDAGEDDDAEQRAVAAHQQRPDRHRP